MEREQRTETIPESLDVWKMQYHNSKHVQHQIKVTEFLGNYHCARDTSMILATRHTFSHNVPLPLFHFFPWRSWRGRRCSPRFAFVMVKINLSFPQNVLELRRTSISRLMHLGTRGVLWSRRRQEDPAHVIDFKGNMVHAVQDKKQGNGPEDSGRESQQR